MIDQDRLWALLDRCHLPGAEFGVSRDGIEVRLSIAGALGMPDPPPGATATLVQNVALGEPMTDEQIIEVAVHGACVAVMHEIQERFTYRGEHVLNPHKVGSIYPTTYECRDLVAKT